MSSPSQNAFHQGIRAWLASAVTLRRLAFASIIANVGIVITGGAVRLTGSGLGCNTWPRCSDESYVATPEMGINSAIEFGNRLLTFVLAAVAILGFVSALLQLERRRRVVLLAVYAGLGIPAQAVLGGITVLTKLNPWVVGCHFLASIAVIAAAFAFWRSTVESDGPVAATVPVPLRWLAAAILAGAAAVTAVGTMVTGSGPHAGDANAKRNGLDPQSIAQVHADLVFLFLGLTVAAWFAFRAVGASAARPTAWLLVISLSQGLIGFVQYFTHLPVVLVGAHMAGAAAVWIGSLAVWYGTRERPITTSSPTAIDRAAEPAPTAA